MLITSGVLITHHDHAILSTQLKFKNKRILNVLHSYHDINRPNRNYKGLNSKKKLYL